MKLTELNKSMNDDQRFALHFGPYHAPPFNYGGYWRHTVLIGY